MQRADFAEVLGRRLFDPGCWLQVITDITRQMGEGMAEFITKEVETVADYDKCASHAALHTSKRLAGSLAEGLVGAQPWQTAPYVREGPYAGCRTISCSDLPCDGCARSHAVVFMPCHSASSSKGSA